MTDPLASLRAEHRDLRAALTALVGIGRHVAAGGSFPSADCAAVLGTLRELTGAHFHKESAFVCASVAAHAEETGAAMAGNVLRLQDEATTLLHSLLLFWEPHGELTEAEAAGFAATAEALAVKMARMGEFEERVLFPLCERSVPADDRIGWPAAFASSDAARGLRVRTVDLAPIARRWTAG